MSARGLLANPALYAGYKQTPEQCVREFLDIGMRFGSPFKLLHHHLAFMMYPSLSRADKQVFGSLQSTPAILDWMQWKAVGSSTDTAVQLDW